MHINGTFEVAAVDTSTIMYPIAVSPCIPGYSREISIIKLRQSEVM